MLCGYVYDPRHGDPTADVPPGVPFDRLPQGWVCPRCGATRADFAPIP